MLIIARGVVDSMVASKLTERLIIQHIYIGKNNTP